MGDPPHRNGLGAIPLATLDREGVARWIEALAAGGRRIDESLVATNTGAAWGNAKNERSRRTIPIDDDTMRVFAKRRAKQAAERLAAGSEWEDNNLDNNLIISTRLGGLVLTRSYDRALARIVDNTGLPRLTSHGLRHSAASQMVQGANDLGELRAIADLLGHSPEMLMNIYAHALPSSQAAVVERLRRNPLISLGFCSPSRELRH